MFPTLAELRDLERETLKVLAETNEFGWFPEMQVAAKNARVSARLWMAT